MEIKDFTFPSSSIDDLFSTPKPIKKASASKVRIASSSELVGFTRVASDTLVHISQKDFWHLGKDDNGYYIERLVDDTDGPVNG
jgi:NADH/NAD ratio-sensing transcriptional regulator Rex